MCIIMIPEQSDEQNTVPAWGSYLYQNYLLPALSPSIATDWLTSSSPFAAPAPQMDYFNFGKGETYQAAKQPDQPQQQQWNNNASAGPSNYYQQPYYQNSIPTSLLMPGYLPQPPAPVESTDISPSIDIIDTVITTSPSPLVEVTPQMSPKRGAKRRAESLESDEHSDHEHEVPEGVERDGIIWGMKVEDYRALSARERKRVRNRISARTFRAKRKGTSCTVTELIERAPILA